MVVTQEDYDKQKKKKIKIDTPYRSSSENERVNPEDIYGIVPSSSHYGAYYLISGEEGNLKCSCPASVECKHLKDIKNGKDTCIRIARYIPPKV